ncbi:MAG: hypothetical protein VKO21_11775 [Candidatus Sericytochromatia bacterium]|nr:hypothetical protein [Candidatus Sericytochromatia bacterium]
MTRYPFHGRLGTAAATLAGLLACTLTVGPAAQAHNYPDPGSHRWQLYNQESVSYTVCEDAISDKQVSKVKVTEQQLSSTPETTTKVTTEERRNLAPIVTVREEERAQAKVPFNKIQGRVQTFYTRQRIDKFKVTTTVQPYDLYDVTRWQHREHKVFAVTYRVTETLTWTDPKTGETLTQAAPAYDETVSENRTTAWENRSSEKRTKSDKDAPVDVDTYLSNREVVEVVGRRAIANFSAAVAGQNVDTGARAFAADRSRSGARAGQASGVQVRSVLGQSKVKAQASASAFSGGNAKQVLMGSAGLQLKVGGVSAQIQSGGLVRYQDKVYVPTAVVRGEDGSIQSVSFVVDGRTLVANP